MKTLNTKSHSQYLASLLANLDPVEASVLGLVHNGATTVEAQDVVSDAACPSGLHLVLVPEKFLARIASSVVELGVRENAEQRTLAGVDITHHSHSTTTPVPRLID